MEEEWQEVVGQILEGHTELEVQAESEEEMQEGALKDGTGGEESREPTLRDLTGILQAFMGQQEAREVKRKGEAKRQEQQFQALENQFKLLQEDVQAAQAHTSPALEPTSNVLHSVEAVDLDGDRRQAKAAASVELIQPANNPSGQSRFSLDPGLKKLTENDVEHFLITFERKAAACWWPRSDLVFQLIPLLTGKA